MKEKDTSRLRAENILLKQQLQAYQLRRAQANLQILQLVEFNNRVLGNLALGLVALDAKGLISLINQRAAEILECPPVHAKGKPLSKYLVEKGGPAKGLLRSLQSRLETIRGEATLRLAGGRERLVSYDISTLVSPQGGREGSILLLADLTRLREQELRLQRQEQLASVGRLSADIAHQVKNPLAGIQSLLQVSLGRLAAEPQVKANLEMVLEEVRKLDRLVSDTLRFARPVALDAQPLALNEVVIEALGLVTPGSSLPSIRVERQLALPSPLVLADRSQLREVILNLVHNALESMPKGGALGVRTGMQKGGKAAEAKGPMAFIKVKDTGAGIPASVAAHIFDPFFTTKPKGSGLGLPTCRRIVDSLGGNIEFSSKPGRGALFTVLLPVVGGH